MGDAERRLSTRIPGKYEINFIHEGDYLISFSKDISVDGMFIQTETPPPVGGLTQLTFSIGEIDQITIDAKVVWVNEKELTADPGMGVQFVNPPDHLKDTILSIVKRVAVLDTGKSA